MSTTENINYGAYTRLPTKVLNKADQANPVIEVLTPHKGVVFVEIKTVDKGFFRKATEIDRKTDSVTQELVTLEEEAKIFLLKNWIKNQV